MGSGEALTAPLGCVDPVNEPEPVPAPGKAGLGLGLGLGAQANWAAP